jgi:excisionase family DNA binding protein
MRRPPKDQEDLTPRLLTTPQLAEYLAVTPSAVRKWVFERRVPFTKIGRLVRFDRRAIDAAIDDGTLGHDTFDSGL